MAKMSERSRNNLLKKLYYNVNEPGSFTAPATFYRAVKEKSNNITRKHVNDWLNAQDTYTLHRRTRKKFRRNRIIVSSIDEQWQTDLIDIQKISRYNQGNRYILVCIDVLSKYAWVEPLKAKSGKNIISAFKKIFKKGRKPLLLQSDQGTEFLNHEFQNYLKSENIHYFHTNNETKAAIAERLIETLKSKMYKYFTYKNTLNYTNILQDLIKSYNNSYHTSIKTKPSLVTKQNEDHIWHVLYDHDLINGKTPFKFHVGDRVRLAKKKGHFEKGYTTNFTTELFEVSKRIARSPPVYKIKDLNGEEIEGTIYASEMQLVK